MNIILLSILLLGPSADTGQFGQGGVRVQAVARAQIVSGESIIFDKRSSRNFAESSSANGRTFRLPLARSENKKTGKGQPDLNIQEFF